MKRVTSYQRLHRAIAVVLALRGSALFSVKQGHCYIGAASPTTFIYLTISIRDCQVVTEKGRERPFSIPDSSVRSGFPLQA